MRRNIWRPSLIALALCLVVGLLAGCETSTLSMDNSTDTGMSGSFRTRTGTVKADFTRNQGALFVEVTTLELAEGSMQLRLEDSAGKVIWQHELVPANEGESLAVTGDLPEKGKWVLKSEAGRQGKYDLRWTWR